jgi:F-type H+-transporting ATPase subunit a
MVVFGAVHFYGVRAQGLSGYLRSYLKPTPFLLPMNVLSEFTRIFSLMVRLFGNMMSHQFVVAIVLAMAGLLVPIPFMALGILIGLIQAYIFTVLALVFIAAGLGVVEKG